MKFNVVLPKFPFSQCLDDLAENLAEGLREYGSVVQRDTFEGVFSSDHVEIALGAHHVKAAFPNHPVVVYQTEVAKEWFSPVYRERLSQAVAIWEAVPGFFQPEFAAKTFSVPPGLSRRHTFEAKEAQGVEKSIDVLFYGSLTERRVRMLEKLHNAGINVEVHFGVFGAERDALIDRSRLVLDIKQRDNDPDDTTRTFVVDSRRGLVLSENDSQPWRRLRPENIVSQVRALLAGGNLALRHWGSRVHPLQPIQLASAVNALADLLPQITKPATPLGFRASSMSIGAGGG